MTNNQINVSVTPSKSFKVDVTAPNQQGNITVSPDTSAYNAEIARQWAVSDTKVLQEDYSSKYYANKSQTSANNAKVYADNAQGVLTQVQGLGTEAIEEINTTKTSAVAEIETIKTIKKDGALLSWAHPIITPDKINPEFFQFLKSKGIEAVEGNYQYSKWDQEYVASIKPDLDKLIKEFDMVSTGGTDSHIKSIF